MALSIVVEDGTGLDNADSYVDTAFVRSYASKRGVALPVSDDDLIPFLIQAMDYIESFADQFIGIPTTTTQALSWPRSNVTVNWIITPNNVVPDKIKQAQAAAAIVASTGTSLMPVESGQFIVSEKIGPLETHYSETRSMGQPSMPQVEALLSRYITSNGFSLITVRA
jgi:hypothetical protein